MAWHRDLLLWLLLVAGAQQPVQAGCRPPNPAVRAMKSLPAATPFCSSLLHLVPQTVSVTVNRVVESPSASASTSSNSDGEGTPGPLQQFSSDVLSAACSSLHLPNATVTVLVGISSQNISRTVQSTSTPPATSSIMSVPTTSANTTSAPTTSSVASTSGSLSMPPFNFTSYAATLSSDAAVLATPIPPLGVNQAGKGVLTPQNTAELYYHAAGDATSDTGTYVRVNMTFEYPAVVLSHSLFVDNIVCNNDSLGASFTNPAVLSYVQSVWSGSSEMILVANSPTCSSEDDANVFFFTTNITFDEYPPALSAQGRIAMPAELARKLAIDVGNLQSNSSGVNASSLDLGCSSPDAADVGGLPAVSCGPSFDQVLDSTIGYYIATESNFQDILSQLAPGLSPGGVVRRSFWSDISSIASSVGDAVSSAASTVASVVSSAVSGVTAAVAAEASDISSILGHAITSAMETVLEDAKYGVVLIGDEIVALVEMIASNTYSNQFSVPLALEFPAPALSQSPFGPAFSIYSKSLSSDDSSYLVQQDALVRLENYIDMTGLEPSLVPQVDIFVVDLDVGGALEITFSVTVDLVDFDFDMSLGAAISLEASNYLGVNGVAALQDSISIGLITKGLKSLTVKHVFILGPMVSVGLAADFSISCPGQAILGGSAELPKIGATVDLQHGVSGQFQSPTCSYKSDIRGALTSEWTAGLEVALEFGIDLLDGIWSKSAKLQDIFGWGASTGFDDNMSYTYNQFYNFSHFTESECPGVTWTMEPVDQLIADLSDIDLGRYTLATWHGPVVATGCASLGPTSAWSVTSSAASATTTTTTTPPPPPTATLTSSSTTSSQVATPTHDLVPPGKTIACEDVTCPLYDGYICWAQSNGEYASWPVLWQVQCTSAYSASRFNPYRINETCAATFGDCIDACSTSTDDITGGLARQCNGVTFLGPDNGGVVDCNEPMSQNCFFFNYGATAYSGYETPGVSAVYSGLYYGWSGDLVGGWTNPYGRRKREATEGNDGAPVRRDETSVVANVTITDVTGKYNLNAAQDGNLLLSEVGFSTTSLDVFTGGISLIAELVPPSSSSSTNDSTAVVVGDSSRRLLYYFPSIMAQTNVSRLRLGTWGAIPWGAQLVTLAPVPVGNTTMLLGIDTYGVASYPVVCTLQNQVNKVFLVDYPSYDTQPPSYITESLKNPDLIYTVIGGVVETCSPLSLQVTAITQ